MTTFPHDTLASTAHSAGGRTSDETITSSLVVEVTLNEAARAAGIEAPYYAQPGDAGADLRSTEHVILHPGQRKLVRTGVSIALPFGFAAFIHPRSGLAAKKGLTVVNSPGTIDAGYRGELMVCLLNTDTTEPIELGVGDRIAQLVLQRVETAAFQVVEELSSSTRGLGGFGSTGGFIDHNATAAEEPVGDLVDDLSVAELTDRLTVAMTTGYVGGVSGAILSPALTLGLVTRSLRHPAEPQKYLTEGSCVLEAALGWLVLLDPEAGLASDALTASEAFTVVRESAEAEEAFQELNVARRGGVGFSDSASLIRTLLKDQSTARAVFRRTGVVNWMEPGAAAV